MLIQREKLTNKRFLIPEILENILKDLVKIESKPLFVGGCVRDFLQNEKTEDFDIEVFNITEDDLKAVLSKYKEPKLVGKSFGVLKLKINSYDFDFSLPRLDIKKGNRHNDFDVIIDSNLSYKNALKRRDFTINAIFFDYFADSFIDPFNGIKDLKNKVLRHILDESFIEDSLRVYRAISFVARFNLALDEKSKELCKSIVLKKELKFLPKQRVFDELKKMFLKSYKPSLGLMLLKELEILEDFCELKTINFNKTLENIDNLAQILNLQNIEKTSKLHLFYSILCKDLNNAETLSFLEKITDEKKFIKDVFTLSSCSFENLNEATLKRLSLKLNLEDLFILQRASTFSFNEKLFLKIKDLGILNREIKALIDGKELIKLGFKQSKEFKEILDFSLQLQIEKDLSKDEIIEKILEKYTQFLK